MSRQRDLREKERKGRARDGKWEAKESKGGAKMADEGIGGRRECRES